MILLLLNDMNESNPAKERKAPPDIVCPPLSRAAKAAHRLAKSGDPTVDAQKFEVLSAQLDVLGVAVGCRFPRAPVTQEETARPP